MKRILAAINRIPTKEKVLAIASIVILAIYSILLTVNITEYYNATVSLDGSTKAKVIVSHTWQGYTVTQLKIAGDRTFNGLDIDFAHDISTPVFSSRPLKNTKIKSTWGLRITTKITEAQYLDTIPLGISGPYRASRGRNVYHHYTCKYIDAIAARNLLVFGSLGEAQLYNLVPCGVCEGAPYTRNRY